jgi:hypothetical protein
MDRIADIEKRLDEMEGRLTNISKSINIGVTAADRQRVREYLNELAAKLPEMIKASIEASRQESQ